MIQRLLERSVELLRSGLGPTMTDAATRIVTGPAVAPGGSATPQIILLPGPLGSSQAAAEAPSSEPRPRALTELIPVTAATTYPLAQTPLDGTFMAEMILDRGTTDERRMLLYPNQDYTLDPAVPNVTFSADLAAASHVRFKYEYAGIYTFREIQQEWYVDILEASYLAAERWASLALAILMTNHDELVLHYNETMPSLYSSSDYVSDHRLITFNWLDASPEAGAQPAHLRLRFQASAQLTLAKTLPGNVGTIEQVRSPGVTPTHPVDVEIGLG